MADGNISKDLVPLAWPIEELIGLNGNPRRGDLEAVKRSLSRFGQFKPIVARRFRNDGEKVNEVLMGNHTFMAAKELGWRQLAVSWETWGDAEAKAAALADNHTSDLAVNDDALLADMLVDIKIDPALLNATSYTEDDIEDLFFLLQTPEVAGVSASERAGLYEAAGIRTIVLPFPIKDYERVSRWLDLLRAKWDRDTNSDAVYCTLESLFGEVVDAAADDPEAD